MYFLFRFLEKYEFYIKALSSVFPWLDFMKNCLPSRDFSLKSFIKFQEKKLYYQHKYLNSLEQKE